MPTVSQTTGFVPLLFRPFTRHRLLHLHQIIPPYLAKHIYHDAIFVADIGAVFYIRGQNDDIAIPYAVQLPFNDLVAVAIHDDHDLLGLVAVRREVGMGFHL